MENPKEAVPTGEDLEDSKSQQFKKSEFTIFMEEMGDGWQLVYVDGEQGEEYEVSDEYYQLPIFNFIRDSYQVLYIAENDEALMELHASEVGEALGVGIGVSAWPSEDGKYMVYGVT